MEPKVVNLSADYKTRAAELPGFFRDVFSASESEEEGRVVSALAADLLKSTPEDDLLGVLAMDRDALAGCILFSRLHYDQDPRQVFLMSPVAVRTDRQKSGIGQKLIGFGLEQLRLHGVDFVTTYGDPAYYSKTGFQPITESIAKPPMPLSMPHGWLGQSLSGDETPIEGPSRCVSAFNRPELW
ncbi:GNAT family N-acetyltransferase [Ruegeria arenilitoris]|uniref:GNAT family N-acetyltransferase n=1 Tax=Ruegeria arenilitoris TaxID=1173585 RepID=UPI001C2C8CFC|nr:N-acetyltransferase [Ruegeria arenilitoris]